MLIDTHAHLQMKDYSMDRDEVIARAIEADVSYIINASFDLASSYLAVKLSEENEHLDAMVGVHPHDAVTLDNDVLKALRELAQHPKVVAVGETGLDYYRDLSPRHVQKTVYEKQIGLALELGLPIVIHNRDAHKDILEILSRNTDQVRGVMHCFSGDRDFADKCIQMGLYISFAGNVTYKNAISLQEVIAHVPDEKFFIETDCPYLTPQLWRGKRNEPSYLKAIAKKIAEIRRTTLPEIGRITTANAIELFKLT